MSSVFSITNKITKCEDDLVFVQLDTLRDIKDQNPSSDLIELVNILKEKYICISELRHLSWEESEEHEQIWADGPLLNNIEGDVFTFSLVSGALGDPVEYILKTANQMGFSIFSYDFDKIWWSTI